MLKKQLMRVEIASKNLQNAPIHKIKKAATALGDETQALLALLIDEITMLKNELKLID